MSYLPAGNSIKTAYHLAQIFLNGLRHYDYGREDNLRKYNSEVPPPYDLSNVIAPVAIYCGANDMFSNEQGANELASKLKNVIQVYKVPDPKFTHLDFVFGKNSKKVLYGNVVGVLRSFPINKTIQENQAVMSDSNQPVMSDSNQPVTSPLNQTAISPSNQAAMSDSNQAVMSDSNQTVTSPSNQAAISPSNQAATSPNQAAMSDSKHAARSSSKKKAKIPYWKFPTVKY